MSKVQRPQDDVGLSLSPVEVRLAIFVAMKLARSQVELTRLLIQTLDIGRWTLDIGHSLLLQTYPQITQISQIQIE